jgi:CheY-like chemotaxis protein
MTAHFLMVDDEPDAQELFCQKFRREIRSGQFSFDFALSGEEALRTIEARPPAAVLSDINMPGMSGVDLLELLRDLCPDLPVVMISAYDDDTTAAKVRALGALDLMPKPVDFAGLRARLADLAGAGA